MFKPHDMLPDRNHDEQARQDFVTSLRGHLAAKVMPGNPILYKTRLEPAFIREHQRSPKDAREVRDIMTANGYHQFWSALQRRSQELLWDSVIDPTERQLDELIEKFRSISKENKAGGSLLLDPELEIPRYHTAADIHIQPGAYHTEFTEDDVAAGAIFEGGAPIYLGGALGPNNDGMGQLLSKFTRGNFPDLTPLKILDMGCGVGASTLAWHETYPEAELYAIDVAAPTLRYAHARAELYGIPVHFSQQNAEATNFEDETFDLVISHAMLHETSKPALTNIFEESKRILKPGGVMLHFDIPKGADLFEQYMYNWEAYNNNESFIQYLSEMDLPGVAVKAGFDSDKARLLIARPDFAESQKNYTDGDIEFRILYGEK